MNQQKIAEVLKTLRKERHLTQEELAEQLNVSAKSVSRWENGINLPDISILIELADFYRVDIRDIILCDRRSETVNNELKDMAEKVADYSHADKEATARRNIIASVVGVASFVAGGLLLFLGSGICALLGLAALAAAFGSLCYILLNSTRKLDEANRKKKGWSTVLCSVLIAFAALILILAAVTYAWFTA